MTAHMRTIPDFCFDANHLREIADRHTRTFRTTPPFPHIVLDDFLPREIFEALANEFPKPGQIDWKLHGPGTARHSNQQNIEKIACSDESQFPSLTRHVLHEFNSATFLRFLERLTGIPGLLADPTYSDCGLHSTGPGGRLMMHIDTNRHPTSRDNKLFHQRLNAIYFLNPDWKDEWGGHLELWDFATRTCHTKVLPAGNRLVIFDTGTRSIHGHPHPLTCPADRRRNSLAAYYYVLDREVSDDYQGFQTEVGWVPITDEERQAFRRHKLRLAVQRVTPPIVIDAYKAIRRRLKGTARAPQ